MSDAPRSESAQVAAAGLVIIDKPAGITSHDVVARCRKIFGTRRIGHAGTLDPMATGVLILGVERATKLLGLLSLTTKSYLATIRLGASSDTDDRDGEIGARSNVAHLDRTDVETAIAGFVGEIDQVPARVSAIKVDGRRAHALARAGAEFELAPRRVTVTRFEVLDARQVEGWLDLDVAVDCSSGTYIRSLARDLGSVLAVGGHLTALRRTAVGPFTIEHAATLEAIAEHGRLNHPIDEAVSLAFPRRVIDDEEAESISQGRWLEPIGMSGVYAAVDRQGRAIALLEEKGRRAGSVLVIRPATLR
ncbi:tRNA pseudouridine(55) synthase TruB [Williamsia sp. CHRR-6]|uniref:tRNA pseudouridine(55) synthase TruB n=1 Tax=Williamsia sp. CHRR-6 TaxID=2835871 RepID=UPI001BD923AA|nr:tRNA pseudouridine(55) synthase TruB [Williamsia sp. CHRR-6]MBT0567861.1 tRNA pseudouridine(55) synthase TruB [Williamsia sp. CHRR-6]